MKAAAVLPVTGLRKFHASEPKNAGAKTARKRMQIHRFQYDRTAHHLLGDGVIVFVLSREEGPFGVELTVEDAERLVADLRVQLPIAAGHR
jgi:hypothetical protein